MTLDCLLTRFFVPTWWVRAYERELSQTASASAAVDPATSVILPSLTEVELDALSILINQCQQQMLAGTSPLSLYKTWHDKHVASHKKADLFAFKRMFSLFGGIRLLVADRDDKAHTMPLFGRELWRQRDGESVVQLDLTDVGTMLVLGYGEPYLCRMAKSTAKALDSLLEGHSPLSLWRAPWLDFKGVEKLVLLRMERAMQWQLSYLTLSGVFEGDFDELTAGIVSERMLARADNPLEMRFSALEKIGKKLADHGYLDWDWEREFLAFNRDSFGQSLIWKIMDSKGQQEDHRSYRIQSAAYLFEQVFLRHLDSILLALFGIRWQDDPSYEPLRAKIDLLLDGPILGKIEVLTMLHGNRPLVNAALFIEWLVRLEQQSQGSIDAEQHSALSAELVGEEVLELLRSVTADNIAERFDTFSRLVADDPRLIEGLKTDPRLTFALGDGPAKHSPAARARTKAATKPAAEQPGEVKAMTTGRTPELTPELKPELKPRPRNPAYGEERPRAQEDTPMTISPQAALKSDAAKHLHKLKATDQRSYQELKKRYLASLAGPEAQAILDMQKILNAQHFDNQIKQSLVQYLLRHPSEWQARTREKSQAEKQRSAEAILKSLLS